MIKQFVMATMLLFTVAACASSSAGSARSTRSPDLITRAELDEVSASSAYDVVTRLRPNWLRATAPGSISGGQVTSHGILVYFDDVRMGGPESLRSIPLTQQVRYIRYLSAQRAPTVLRDIGRENIAGAIVVSTKD